MESGLIGIEQNNKIKSAICQLGRFVAHVVLYSKDFLCHIFLAK
jgi:hypothetical protein